MEQNAATGASEEALNQARTLGLNVDNLCLRLDVPEWWSKGNNYLLAPLGINLPVLEKAPNLEGLPTNSLIVLHSGGPFIIMVWGDKSIVAVESGCILDGSQLRCGGGSLQIGHGFSCGPLLEIDVRNGGSIEIGKFCIAGPRVRIATDDMHPIIDMVTNERINKFGGSIKIANNVWLGLECIVNGGADIDHDTVVGARGLVTGKLPSNSICVGIPAKPVRQGVRWEREDHP